MDRARFTIAHSLRVAAMALLFAMLAAFFPAMAFADEAAEPEEVSVEYQIRENFQSDKGDLARESVKLVAVKPKASTVAAKARAVQVEQELSLGTQASSWSRAELKSALKEAFEKRSTSVKVSSIKIPANDSSFSAAMKELRREILEENPQIFWMSTAESWSFKYSGRTYVTLVSITSKYAFTEDQIKTMQGKYDAALADIGKWLTASGASSAVEKAKVVHDWLVRNCVYNKAALTKGGPVNFGSINPWTAYGALVDDGKGNGHKPVCQGYTYAFNAALAKFGIGTGKCITEVAANGSAHMWSSAAIGGKWYNVDVTHDDPLKQNSSVDFGFSDTPRTTFFLKSDTYFLKTADKGLDGSYHVKYSPQKASDTSYDSKKWTAYNASGPVKADPKSLGDSAKVTVYDQTYTGDAITPSTKVVANGKTLSKGSDYTVTYSDNTEAGTATVTVKGAGAYSGNAKATFEIEPASIKGATVTGISAKNYTGKAIKQSPVVKVGSKTLKSGTDYTVSYSDNTKAGTAKLTIKGKGNYTGSISKSFTISKVNISTNPKVTVSNVGNKTYAGKALTPAVTVAISGTAYTKGTDYTVSYSNNTKAGTATVTIKGKGSCTGTVTKKFKIAALDMKKAKISGISNKKYTGKAITQKVVVKSGSSALKQGTDYTVSYKNNKKKGTATVTIKGKGSCAGSVNKTFKIS